MARIKEAPSDKIKRLESEIAAEKEKIEKSKELIKAKEKEIEEQKHALFSDLDGELHDFLFKAGIMSTAEFQSIVDLVKSNIKESSSNPTI